MKMRTRRISTTAHLGDTIATLHSIANPYLYVANVSVQRSKVITVVEKHQTPILAPRSGANYSAGSRSPDFIASLSVDVYSPMARPLAAGPEPASDPAAQRPGERSDDCFLGTRGTRRPWNEDQRARAEFSRVANAIRLRQRFQWHLVGARHGREGLTGPEFVINPVWFGQNIFRPKGVIRARLMFGLPTKHLRLRRDGFSLGDSIENR